MPSPADESRPSTTLLFVVIAVLFFGGFAAFFTWSVSRRQATQEAARARALEAEARQRAEAPRDEAPRPVPEAAAPLTPLAAQPSATPTSPRRPSARELPNGDREVTLLDGTVVIQPLAEREKFALFAEGERNDLGLPSGVLPDGSYLYENMPVTVDQRGRRVEILTRARASKVAGGVVEGEVPPTDPRKN
jgi:hypothetical protein